MTVMHVCLFSLLSSLVELLLVLVLKIMIVPCFPGNYLLRLLNRSVLKQHYSFHLHKKLNELRGKCRFQRPTILRDSSGRILSKGIIQRRPKNLLTNNFRHRQRSTSFNLGSTKSIKSSNTKKNPGNRRSNRKTVTIIV